VYGQSDVLAFDQVQGSEGVGQSVRRMKRERGKSEGRG